jgi:hypothetical protein
MNKKVEIGKRVRKAIWWSNGSIGIMGGKWKKVRKTKLSGKRPLEKW